MRDTITNAMKDAMKAGDKLRVSTLRLVNSAIKDRDIAQRGAGKEASSDAEIAELMAKMVKQREESARIYRDGGRSELEAQELAEIEILREFMPKQMSADEVRSAVSAIIAETGAASIKDMGKVMGVLRSKYAGQMDMASAGAAVKAALSS